MHFKINAFPFLTQDAITTTCAEVTLLNILDYYSNQYSDYKFLTPSDIDRIVKINNYDRTIPTAGLTYETISKILCESGFSPKFYFKNKNMETNDIKRFISYYVESGIPVAIGLNPKELKSHRPKTIGHSVICVGHGECDFKLSHIQVNTANDSKIKYINSVDTYSNYIIQDDNKIPYSLFEIEKNGILKYNEDECYTIDCFVVPLYKRMYMDAQKAENTINAILNSEKCFLYDIQPYDKPLIFRLFLASSRHFKYFRKNKVEDEVMNKIYQQTPLPQFIWVCELYTMEGYGEHMAIGEIILDATYSGQNLLDSMLMMNYRDHHIAKDTYFNSIFIYKDDFNNTISQWDEFVAENECKYPSYTLNLNNRMKK